ncbi:MAG: hypothetical protein ACM3PZ_00205 [Bacillota bacterium]
MKIHTLRRLAACLILTSALLAGFFIPTSSWAQTENNYGLDDSAEKVGAYQAQINSSDNFLTTKVGSIIGIVLSFVGVIFLVLIIYAGLNWMTASGNADKVGKSKDMMINAVIGLIIVLAAYAITAFVGDRLL